MNMKRFPLQIQSRLFERWLTPKEYILILLAYCALTQGGCASYLTSPFRGKAKTSDVVSKGTVGVYMTARYEYPKGINLHRWLIEDLRKELNTDDIYMLFPEEIGIDSVWIYNLVKEAHIIENKKKDLHYQKIRHEEILEEVAKRSSKDLFQTEKRELESKKKYAEEEIKKIEKKEKEIKNLKKKKVVEIPDDWQNRFSYIVFIDWSVGRKDVYTRLYWKIETVLLLECDKGKFELLANKRRRRWRDA